MAAGDSEGSSSQAGWEAGDTSGTLSIPYRPETTPQPRAQTAGRLLPQLHLPARAPCSLSQAKKGSWTLWQCHVDAASSPDSSTASPGTELLSWLLLLLRQGVLAGAGQAQVGTGW